MTKHFVRTFGEGPVPVFALHCSLAHSGAWTGVASQIGKDVTLRAIDLPGHGRSFNPEDPREAAELTLAWASEEISEPVHLFGHSFGAYVALRVAVEYPEKVLSLSLYEPVFFAAARAAHSDAFAENLQFMASLDALMRDGDTATATERFVERWGDGRPWSEIPKLMRDQMIRGMPLVIGANGALMEDDGCVLDRLPSINVPCLLMDGADSPALMSLLQDAIAEAIPKARRETLAGAGHMGVVTHPQDVARAFAKQIGA